MDLTYEQAKEIREGILMGRRNYQDNCEASYDSQEPRGKLRARAYRRTWIRELQGKNYFPPRASSTKRHPAKHGPSFEERKQAFFAQAGMR